jgi:hypothetical protein
MERQTHRYSNNFDKKITSMHSYDRYKKYVQYVLSTLAFRFRLLLLDIFKVDVLKVLRQLALYTMIDMPETRNIHKINQTEQHKKDF